MKQNVKKIAILLDGQIQNDARVIKLVRSFSGFMEVDLYCLFSENQNNSFTDVENVSIVNYSLKSSRVINNISWGKKFEDLKNLVLSKVELYNYIYINDYPLLSCFGKEIKTISPCIIYDSHEIYIETINQFYPQKGWRSVYGFPLIWINKMLHGFLEKKYVKNVDHVITVGKYVAEHLKNVFGIDQIHVLPNYPSDLMEVKSSDMLRKELSLKPNDKIILYQGSINIGRGLEKMFEAIELMPSNFHFVLLGDGPKYFDFKNIYRNPRIHFYGRVDFTELTELTASADLGVVLIEPINLSKKYSLPNKIFEYLWAGIPFVTNKLPEVKCLVEELEGGFVIDDKSPASITREIKAILKDTSRKKDKKNIQQKLKTHYFWDKSFKVVWKEILNYERC